MAGGINGNPGSHIQTIQKFCQEQGYEFGFLLEGKGVGTGEGTLYYTAGNPTDGWQRPTCEGGTCYLATKINCCK